jgi:hypothetical protein
MAEDAGAAEKASQYTAQTAARNAGGDRDDDEPGSTRQSEPPHATAGAQVRGALREI